MQKDKIVFDNKFSFDQNTANCFSDMISRSIPGYDSMRYLTFNLAKHFVKKGTDIVDIGCSNGESIHEFVRTFGALNMYRLIDVSEPMVNAAKEKYKGLIDCGIVDVKLHDLRNGLPLQYNASVVLSILTLQFIPIEYRQKILSDIYSCLNKYGCFIFVEKLLCNNNESDNLFVEEYYNIKKINGYSDEQIQSKRKALENFLVPLTENMNIELLKNIGFKKIDCFWRCLNFAGYICIK